MSPTVNKPTDVKKRDADIGRKLQFYGIASAFKAGKVPSVSASLIVDSRAAMAPDVLISPYRTTKSTLP